MAAPALGLVPDLAPAPTLPRARSGRRITLAQIVRFLIVGGLCTGAYTVLYLSLGKVVSHQLANTIALVLSAVLNTALNRRHTFGVTGRRGVAREHGQGLVIMALNWVLTTSALMILHRTSPDATHTTQIVVLTAANAAASIIRYTLLRFWVFRR